MYIRTYVWRIVCIKNNFNTNVISNFLARQSVPKEIYIQFKRIARRWCLLSRHAIESKDIKVYSASKTN